MILNSINKPVSTNFQGSKQANNSNPIYKGRLSLKTLENDIVSFGKITKGVVEDMEFKSVLDKQLVTKPNTDFKTRLSKIQGVKQKNVEQAAIRVSSLSRYLKEDMVGFVVPKYEHNGEQKGGYQWMEKGIENLLKGCHRYLMPENYQSTAKELFGILATHDNYWKSDNFINHLTTLNQSEAIKATIDAVKELQAQKETPSFTGTFLKMYGIFSPIKAMDKLLDDGCAYSGEKLIFDDPTKKHARIDPKNNASIEHIVPQSWGGLDDDSNYMLTSVDTNSKRGNVNLLQYLKGM